MQSSEIYPSQYTFPSEQSSAMQSSEIYPSQYTFPPSTMQPQRPLPPPSFTPPSFVPKNILSPEDNMILDRMSLINPNYFVNTPPNLLQNQRDYLKQDLNKLSRELGGLKRTKNKTYIVNHQIEQFTMQRDAIRKYISLIDDYLKTFK